MPGIFHLHVQHTGESNYSVGTTGRPEDGQAVTFRPSDDLEAKIKKLHDRGVQRPTLSIPEHDALCSEIGEELFDVFIRDPPGVYDAFRGCYEKAGPPRTALHLPTGLFRFPWEVLRDSKDARGSFIATDGSIFRCYVGAPGLSARTNDFPPVRPPLRILYILSNPADRSFGTIGTLENNAHVEFLAVDPASYENYRHQARAQSGAPGDFAFAFFGHGDVAKEAGVELGQIVFVELIRRNLIMRVPQQDPRPPWSLVDGIPAGLRFGICCACDSARAAGAIEFANSIVGATLERGKSLAYIVGAQTPIDATASAVLLGGTLGRLHEQPLDRALSDARVDIRAMPGGANHLRRLDWWIPTLYTKTTNLQILDTTAALVPAVPADPATIAVNARAEASGPIEIAPIVGAALRALKTTWGSTDADIFT